MANAFEIASDKLSSAIFGGFAAQNFKDSFTSGFNNAVVNVQALGTLIKTKFDAAVNAFKQGWTFFQNWMKADPISATAGAGAVLLSAGVLLVSGGAILGAVAGSVAALKTVGLLSLAGKAVTILGAAGTLGALLRFAVRGVQFAWRFNWQTTDKQLKEQQEGLINSLYGQAGTAIGSTLGTLLCGSAPVALLERSNLVRVNPVALAKIKEITEFDPLTDNYGGLYEEMMENLKALVNAGTRVATQWLFIESFKNIRKWIKAGSKFVGLSKIFPGLANLIAKWGEEGSQAWSFASATEDFVESIDDKNLQNFTEEFLESFMEACTESVMVISYAI